MPVTYLDDEPKITYLDEPKKVTYLDKPSKVNKKPSSKIIYLDEEPKSKITYLDKRDVGQYIKEHPFKSALQPLPVTLGGLSAKEKLTEKFLPETRANTPATEFLKTFGLGVVGDIADIATTPASYIPIPVAKIVGKIPFKGTTLGRIAKTIPLGKGFVKSAEELGRYETALKNLPSRVAQSREPLGIVDPVQKITQAIKEAKPIRKEQEALYSAERSKRVGEVISAGKISGEKGYFAQLGALKGELPKVQFEGIRGKISQPDIDNLFNTVEKHPVLTPFDKVTAKDGLAKLLGEGGGKVPTEGELKLLGEVFPKDFIDTVLAKRSLLQKFGQGIAEVLNVPRAIMASTDLSGLFRQIEFLISRPKQFIPAGLSQFKYFFSEKAYQGLYKDIQSRATYPLMTEGRLNITKIGGSLTQREEVFMSNLAEKIPVIGHIVRASNRAFTGLMNKMRADVFDDLVKKARKSGLEPKGKLLTDIGNFVNTATGRGSLGNFEQASVVLNSVFFSPRLMASRLNLLNPIYYAKLDPFVRKEALKSLFGFTTTISTVLGLAKMGGAEVNFDPRSSDFAKIKIGNTRYDVAGGFQQYIRATAQLITGEHVSSTTGVKTTVGEGYKPLTRLGILGRFFQTKENPVLSFATTLLKGQTFFGEKPEIFKEIGLRFLPMVIQDMYDLVKERQLEDVWMVTPAIFGVGVQTYSPDAKEMVYSSNSVLKHSKELFKQGREEEANDLLVKNKELVLIGKKLEPTQKIINKINNIKETALKSINLTTEQKNNIIRRSDNKIKELQFKLDDEYKSLKKVIRPESKKQISIRGLITYLNGE